MRARPLLGTLTVCALAWATACGSAEVAREDRHLAATTVTAEYSVELRDIAFAPAALEVGVDQVVDLRIQNTGTIDHDFTIEGIPADAVVLGRQAAEHQGHARAYPVHAAPGPGEALTVRLHAHQAGTYTYYCTVKGHREAGMAGTLVVS